MDLTPEQSRQIDAAVAQCMGLNVVATEWLCLYGSGKFTIEAYRFPDNNEPPYFIFKRGRPSGIEAIRPVYVPEDGEYWPPVWYKPEDKDEGYWCASVEPVPAYATDPAANAQLWDWLISQGWYVALKYLNSELAQVHQAAVFRFKPTVVYSEDERDNRYLALCMAFLQAMGVDIDALLAGRDTAGKQVVYLPTP